MGKLQTKLQTQSGEGIFTASTLKILACIFMAVDHVGAYLFPHILWLRLVGRLAFPIFAYFIAEGCIYTRNKPKRLITIALLGTVCEAAYIIHAGELYGNILLTFTLSIVLIYCMQELKKILKQGSFTKSLCGVLVFAVILLAVYKLSGLLSVDYGFAGVMVPVFTAVFDNKNRKNLQLLFFCLGLLFVILQIGINSGQVWCLFAVPFIALYNGQPGVKKFKYGFYAFYPVHLAVIWLIGMFM